MCLPGIHKQRGSHSSPQLVTLRGRSVFETHASEGVHFAGGQFGIGNRTEAGGFVDIDLPAVLR
jgi:hypothetical protein